MKIKHIDTKIKLLPCRYCGKKPIREIERHYSEMAVVLIDKIKCKNCDGNYVKNVDCFRYASENVFAKPTEILWNEQQRY